MPKFRKKPVVIEAVQYTGGVGSEVVVASFVGHNLRIRIENAEVVVVIPTLEGDMLASPGDWIIKGVAGEFYPCKPDIFKATYEEVA